MIGGGTFVTQNKILAGAYINFVSAAYSNVTLGDRGYACMALPLKWGVDDAMFTVEAADFRKNCLKIFGFTYDSDDAKGLRDLFKNITTLYCYKLMNGGAKASNTIATAKYKGSAGTKIATEILTGTTSGTFDVNIYFGSDLVYSANVSSLDELKAEDNGYVDWKLTTLAASTKALLTGEDLDGDEISSTQHSAFLDASESYQFNAMACLADTDAIKELYVQECKDMRDSAGIKYQLVVYGKSADYEGVVNVKNSIDAVYWATGAVAGCAINASLTNKKYDGEFDLSSKYTKTQLENAIKAGEFVFHMVGDEVRVLSDINSLVTLTESKGKDFQSNQTIRVCDQIAMDIATLFNTYYLGKVQNDASGRISLWNEIVKHHQELETLRAIENFSADDVTVEQGDTKKSVVVTDNVSIVNAMEQLYMTVVVA